METKGLYGLLVYSTAWKVLQDRIAASRRRTFTKTDLNGMLFQALEEAIDGLSKLSPIEVTDGQQEEA